MKTTEEKQQEIMDFLKQAFCIDGEVLVLGTSEVWVDGEDQPYKKSVTYQLFDSNRGEMIVTLSK